jgi:anti-sigma regulatory factor (Ser/Thr protein kinase)
VSGLPVSMALPGVPESVRRFRQLVREQSDTPYQAECAALLVSELVTNAILHSRSGGGGLVLVRIGPAPVAGELRIEVTDDGTDVPGAWLSPALDGGGLAAGDATEHGRGLAIVDAVASDWARERAPGGGWRTWCDIPESADTRACPCPRRSASTSAAPAAASLAKKTGAVRGAAPSPLSPRPARAGRALASVAGTSTATHAERI